MRFPLRPRSQTTVDLLTTSCRTVLDTIVKSHPAYEITALLRRTPDAFSQTYPTVKVVTGDYDSVDLISESAAQADLVIR